LCGVNQKLLAEALSSVKRGKYNISLLLAHPQAAQPYPTPILDFLIFFFIFLMGCKRLLFITLLVPYPLITQQVKSYGA